VVVDEDVPDHRVGGTVQEEGRPLAARSVVVLYEGAGADLDGDRRLWGAADERQELGLDVSVIGDVDARPVLAALA